MVSTDVHDHKDADKLLQEISKLYITIRGHFLTVTWMEQYKRASQHSRAKSEVLEKIFANILLNFHNIYKFKQTT